MRFHATVAAATLLAASLAPARGSACGGLFCNVAQPVVQSGERIVFVDNGDGTMSMMVEILYAGPSQSFAWVLPVAGVPQISVGSTPALAALDAATRPFFQITSSGSSCLFPTGAVDGAVFGGFADASVGADSGVIVQDQGTVGPYDYVIVSVDPLLPSPADAGKEWLVAHGYDVSTLGADTLAVYLQGGQNLLAFRLTKSATTGSIRPVIMTYSSSVPVIPIRPTALAAQNGMGVIVFLYGGSRAVPTSYDEIVVPDEALSWSNPYGSYLSLVSTAVDAAGGHAFVTERAGAAPSITAGGTSARTNLAALATSGVTDPPGMVASIIATFGGMEGVGDVLARNGVTFQRPDPFDAGTGTALTYAQALATSFYDVVIAPTFDRAAVLADLDALVVTPLEDTEALLARRPYLTRLYTTLDPSEMNLDPVFAFATGLPDVSNVHTVTLVSTCTNTGPFTYTLFPSGRSIVGTNPPPALPQILRWYDYSAGGVPTLVQDNAAGVVANTLATPPTPPDAGVIPAYDGGSDASTIADGSIDVVGRLAGGGCSVGAIDTPGAGARSALAGLALAAVATRRRRRR